MAQRFWHFVWDLSEFTGIPLGRFAPAVFHRAFGLCAPVEVTEDEFIAMLDRYKAVAERGPGGDRGT